MNIFWMIFSVALLHCFIGIDFKMKCLTFDGQQVKIQIWYVSSAAILFLRVYFCPQFFCFKCFFVGGEALLKEYDCKDDVARR